MDIRLRAIPEHPPIEVHERYEHKANYTTTLAYLHILIDGENVIPNVSSAYMMWLLDHLLAGVAKLLQGKDVEVPWVADPWQLDLHPMLKKNRVRLTFRMPARIRDIEVPLEWFIQEAIGLGKSWRKYIVGIYPDEVFHPEKGRDFRLFEKHLQSAEEAWMMQSKKSKPVVVRRK
jgi:hypothetical protein